jgi:hypothetical protein
VNKIGDKIPGQAPGKLIEIAARPRENKLWGTTIWLQEGIYRIEAKAKVTGVPVPENKDGLPSAQAAVKYPENTQLDGAGFRIWSRRKYTEGVEWGWFPYSESRNFKKRGLLPPRPGTGEGLYGTADWTPISYEFEMKQPLADLVLFFELRESAGTAVLDTESVTITRLTK